jgi:hypothetical protein
MARCLPGIQLARRIQPMRLEHKQLKSGALGHSSICTCKLRATATHASCASVSRFSSAGMP